MVSGNNRLLVVLVASIGLVFLFSGCSGSPEPKATEENEVVNEYIERVERDYREHLARAGELEGKKGRLEKLLEELEKDEFDEEAIGKLVLRDRSYEREIEELKLKKARIERMLQETERENAEFDEKWKKYEAEYDRLIKKYEELGKLLEKSTRMVEEEALQEGK